MAAHNEAQFIESSLRSVLNQTCQSFEIVLVDDASNDGTGELVEKLGDPRIRILRNEENLGLARSLNRGLYLCRGRFIARMDADDLCAPSRFQKQSAYLERHPDVVLLGSFARTMSEKGEIGKSLVRPVTDLEIRWMALMANPFIHPSVMLRTETLKKEELCYRENLRTAQDYALWSELLGKGKGVNLPRHLVDYRIRRGLSVGNRADQLGNTFRIVEENLQRLLPSAGLSPEVVRALATLVYYRDAADSELRQKWRSHQRHLVKLFKAFQANIGSSPELNRFFAEQTITLAGLYPGGEELRTFAWTLSDNKPAFLFKHLMASVKQRLRRG